jgi:hypothetical protein
MCAVLPVKRGSDSEWAKLQQVGNVKREPRIWLNITLIPNIRVFRNKILWYDMIYF